MGISDRHDHHDSPLLVGREREQAALQAHLKSALAGRGSLALIGGEARIGKSSLALAAGRRAQTEGAVFGPGRSDERSGAPPFAPWQELLDDLRASVAIAPATLPPPFGDGPLTSSAYELMRVVAGWLRSAAANRPLVLLLDDLHWANADTLDLLRFIMRDLARVPLAILATYREEIERGQPLFAVLPELQRDRPVASIRLAALGTDDLARLVEARLGPCGPDLAAYLRARADSTPFYAVELLRDLVHQARTWQKPWAFSGVVSQYSPDRHGRRTCPMHHFVQDCVQDRYVVPTTGPTN